MEGYTLNEAAELLGPEVAARLPCHRGGHGSQYSRNGQLSRSAGAADSRLPLWSRGSTTFIRIKYLGRREWSWLVDHPASDQNFSARFQEVTGIPTDPNGKVLQLTDPDLRQYPFLYISEGGGVLLSDTEIRSLREYLLGGGFLMVDDFWAEAEWRHFHTQIKRVFPDREPFELDLDHPIFNCFYKIEEKPQVPMIAVAIRNQSTGITWEREDAKEPHYFGLEDDDARLMAVFCHNTDLADGWEREGENEYYDQEFVFKKTYPMGIPACRTQAWDGLCPRWLTG